MPHDAHDHDHRHVAPGTGDRRLLLAILANFALTGAQIVGGLMAGSLALIADALHNFSDAISLVIAFLARRIARRPADSGMTFGYGRAETVAALVNYTTLIMIGFYLIYEAVLRFLNPQDVDGWLIVIIAAIALAVDLVTAALTWSMSKTSMNIRAAFLHNVADALGSVAVIVVGVLVMLHDWRLADPIATLLIAGYILWHAGSDIGGVIRMLMLGSPPGLDAARIAAEIEALDGVEGAHHIHLWRMQEHEPAFEAHIVVADAAWPQAEAIRARVKALLADRFGVAHVTLELETAARGCRGARVFGH